MDEFTDNNLTTADYVVVGTGSAGSIVAERLSADPPEAFRFDHRGRRNGAIPGQWRGVLCDGSDAGCRRGWLVDLTPFSRAFPRIE